MPRCFRVFFSTFKIQKFGPQVILMPHLVFKSRKCVIPVVCVKLGKRYVVKHNLITEVYLMAM